MITNYIVLELGCSSWEIILPFYLRSCTSYFEMFASKPPKHGWHRWKMNIARIHWQRFNIKSKFYTSYKSFSWHLLFYNISLLSFDFIICEIVFLIRKLYLILCIFVTLIMFYFIWAWTSASGERRGIIK